jgi:hypothetical protein
MLISRAEAQKFDRKALFDFLALRMPEGAQIDYKSALSGGSKDETYKEFLKDVTGLANATGGLLLIGVKEPADGLEPGAQAIGIKDGDDLARDLERVAATSIDPRIPGLTINPVQVQQDRYVILVHIPPTLLRPHMVSHGKHRTFYVRHSESSVPMTTHEIRDAVLASATSEARALSYAQEQETEALEYLILDHPGFLLQAMPLLRLETLWDTSDPSISSVLQGDSRPGKYKYDHMCLRSGIRPIPTISGIAARESLDSEAWLVEVHRNGFIQTVYSDIDTANQDQSLFVLHEGYADLFRSFAEICEALWAITQTDIPYLFRARYFNAEKTVFLAGGRYRNYTPRYQRRTIAWPDQVRNVGEKVLEIWRTWTEQLFHAFGLPWRAPTP